MPDSPVPPLHALVCALLAASVALHGQHRLARGAGAAMVGFALGIAGLAVVSSEGQPTSAAFLSISAGLMLPASALQAALAWDGRAHRGQLLLALLACGAALAVTIPVWRGGEWWLAPLVAASVILIAGLSTVLARRLRGAAAFRWLGQRLPARSGSPARDGTATLAVALQLGCAVVAFGAERLDPVLGAILAGAATGHLLDRRKGTPVGLAILVLCLLPSWWLLSQVADPAAPRTLEQLGSAPFSPALERLVAPLLLLAAWPLFRLWPFHGGGLGCFGPLLGASVLLRVVVPLFPAEAAHWLPLAAALAALGSLHASAARDRSEALFALSAVAALARFGVSEWPVAVVVAAGSVTILGAGWRGPWPRAVARWGAPVPAAAALPAALAFALAGETVWTTVIAAGIAASWVDEPETEHILVDRADHPGHIPTSAPGISPAH